MHSIDYEDIFASTMKFDTLCVFLTLVALENLKCHQMNVNNAFTEFFLKKIIYMTSLSDVEVASDCALCIMWSLYELKQVTKDWHEWCVAELVKIEFHQSDADSCLLLHSQKNIILCDDKQRSEVLWLSKMSHSLSTQWSLIKTSLNQLS